jgi:hypothetical protein
MAKAAIESYIRKAPAQTQTELRQQVEAEFGWIRIPLGAEFFEDGVAEPEPEPPKDEDPEPQQSPRSHGSA